MKRDSIINEKYKYVSSGYIRKELKYHGADILKMKYCGILEPYSDGDGPIRSIYTLSSFLKLKLFVEEYVEKWGIKPPISVCEKELKTKKEGSLGR